MDRFEIKTPTILVTKSNEADSYGYVIDSESLYNLISESLSNGKLVEILQQGNVVIVRWASK